MPRKAAHTAEDLANGALDQFWTRGFSATSMDDLVRATGVSRHGIYKSFSGKDELFAAVFERYDAEVVTPAFQQVEEPRAGLGAIGAYLEQQIALAEETGLPGPGCLVANTQSEPAAHSPEVLEAICAHRDRLRAGFRAALQADAVDLTTEDADAISLFLLTAVQGLWSASRVTGQAEDLRAIARTILDLVRTRIDHA